MRGSTLFCCLVLLLGLIYDEAAADADRVYVFGLSGSQEVPPNGSLADGVCVARLNAAGTELRVTCQHDVGSPTGAHIHNAPAGTSGGIVFRFASAVSPFQGLWSLTPTDVADLEAGELYVNVHSNAFPGGEIRGQIGLPAEYGFSFPLEEGQEAPPTGSLASGACDAALDAALTNLATACFHDVSGVTAAHIHAAPPGVNGPVEFPFADATSPFLGVWAIDAQGLTDLVASNLYVNVHSSTFPGGEIRGQFRAVPFFADGFESGDVNAWDSAAP